MDPMDIRNWGQTVANADSELSKLKIINIKFICVQQSYMSVCKGGSNSGDYLHFTTAMHFYTDTKCNLRHGIVFDSLRTRLVIATLRHRYLTKRNDLDGGECNCGRWRIDEE